MILKRGQLYGGKGELYPFSGLLFEFSHKTERGCENRSLQRLFSQPLSALQRYKLDAPLLAAGLLTGQRSKH